MFARETSAGPLVETGDATVKFKFIHKKKRGVFRLLFFFSSPGHVTVLVFLSGHVGQLDMLERIAFLNVAGVFSLSVSS